MKPMRFLLAVLALLAGVYAASRHNRWGDVGVMALAQVGIRGAYEGALQFVGVVKQPNSPARVLLASTCCGAPCPHSFRCATHNRGRPIPRSADAVQPGRHVVEKHAVAGADIDHPEGPAAEQAPARLFFNSRRSR